MNGRKKIKISWSYGKEQALCRIIILSLSSCVAVYYTFTKFKNEEMLFSYNSDGFLIGLSLICFIIFFLYILSGFYALLDKTNISLFKDLYEYYLKNSVQKGWNDLLICFIMFPIFNSIINFLLPDIVINKFSQFKVWKIIAISMSVFLTIIYYKDMFEKLNKISQQKMIIFNEKDLPSKLLIFYLVTVVCIFCLLLAIFFCAIDFNNTIILFILCVCTILFIIADDKFKSSFSFLKEEKRIQSLLLNNLKQNKDFNDLPINDKTVLIELGIIKTESHNITPFGSNKIEIIRTYYESIELEQNENSNAKNNELSHDEISFIINNYRSSFLYGNLPGLFGFVILLITSILLRDESAISSFIAGGAAMHMIFGNIVVAIGLRSALEEF